MFRFLLRGKIYKGYSAMPAVCNKQVAGSEPVGTFANQQVCSNR